MSFESFDLSVNFVFAHASLFLRSVSGNYHYDESIDKITVSAVGGGHLRAGGVAEIKADVFPWR